MSTVLETALPESSGIPPKAGTRQGRKRQSFGKMQRHRLDVVYTSKGLTRARIPDRRHLSINHGPAVFALDNARASLNSPLTGISAEPERLI
jgi:hypothetical protein